MHAPGDDVVSLGECRIKPRCAAIANYFSESQLVFVHDILVVHPKIKIARRIAIKQ